VTTRSGHRRPTPEGSALTSSSSAAAAESASPRRRRRGTASTPATTSAPTATPPTTSATAHSTASGEGRTATRRSSSRRPSTERTGGDTATPEGPPAAASATRAPRSPRTRPSRAASTTARASNPRASKKTEASKKTGTPRSSGRRTSSPAGELVTGTIRIHPRGFAFLAPDTAGADDLFCAPGTFSGAIDGDRVGARVAGDRAVSLTVEARGRREVVGTVRRRSDKLALELDAHLGDLTIDLHGEADEGETVIAALSSSEPLIATVRERFAAGDDADRARVLVRAELPRTMPPGADAVRLGQLRRGMRRRDLRDVVTFTIDDAHSRDLDDALSVTPADGSGYITLSVHIADVAEHVIAGSDADTAARDVATSIYLHPWVRPMLDADLSEKTLSLLPGEDRDTVTVDMRVGLEGEIVSVDVYESRIRSAGRLDYTTASDVLREATTDVDGAVVETLRWLRAASARLASARSRRGGLSPRFSDPELHGQGPARDLIETCMVAANESVARWMADRGIAGLWRVHDGPQADDVADIDALMGRLGYHSGLAGAVTPRAMAALDAQLTGADAATVALWHATLERLGRARYVDSPGQHFGLGSHCYTHFTSPLRRYADLVVHRAVKAHLRGERLDQGDLAALATHITTQSGRASRAEAQLRTTRRLREIGAVGDHVGAIITAIGSNAVSVWVDGGVRAKLPLRSLPGHWTYDGVCLNDSRGRRLCPGERITARITAMDADAGTVALAGT
jgi:ribonuclease R